MSSLNKVFLIGRLGHDPKILCDKSGVMYATEIGLATSEKWRDKTTGEKKEKTEWHNVIFYNKLAEISAEYLKKGSLVHIEGKIESHKYTGKDGAERTAYKIIASSMTILSSKKEQINDIQNNTKQEKVDTDIVDDVIPF